MFNDYEVQVIAKERVREFEGLMKEQILRNPAKHTKKQIPIFKQATVQTDCCQAACC
ncbi:hypothetical protein [Bacillus sp. M6-12]|uniref:hypothetical protein n=1 Tax=Bacillus sp. M6-12 TaxID=2054166 RepID=UPI0015E12347|nr:hypothetical protein [Bacillus sp. M6-12]